MDSQQQQDIKIDLDYDLVSEDNELIDNLKWASVLHDHRYFKMPRSPSPTTTTTTTKSSKATSIKVQKGLPENSIDKKPSPLFKKSTFNYVIPISKLSKSSFRYKYRSPSPPIRSKPTPTKDNIRIKIRPKITEFKQPLPFKNTIKKPSPFVRQSKVGQLKSFNNSNSNSSAEELKQNSSSFRRPFSPPAYPVPKSSKKIKKPCKYFSRPTGCRYTANTCQYQHELLPIYNLARCREFYDFGTCRFGPECRFSHDESFFSAISANSPDYFTLFERQPDKKKPQVEDKIKLPNLHDEFNSLGGISGVSPTLESPANYNLFERQPIKEKAKPQVKNQTKQQMVQVEYEDSEAEETPKNRLKKKIKKKSIHRQNVKAKPLKKRTAVKRQNTDHITWEESEEIIKKTSNLFSRIRDQDQDQTEKVQDTLRNDSIPKKRRVSFFEKDEAEITKTIEVKSSQSPPESNLLSRSEEIEKFRQILTKRPVYDDGLMYDDETTDDETTDVSSDYDDYEIGDDVKALMEATTGLYGEKYQFQNENDEEKTHFFSNTKYPYQFKISDNKVIVPCVPPLASSTKAETSTSNPDEDKLVVISKESIQDFFKLLKDGENSMEDSNCQDSITLNYETHQPIGSSSKEAEVEANTEDIVVSPSHPK